MFHNLPFPLVTFIHGHEKANRHSCHHHLLPWDETHTTAHTHMHSHNFLCTNFCVCVVAFPASNTSLSTGKKKLCNKKQHLRGTCRISNIYPPPHTEHWRGGEGHFCIFAGMVPTFFSWGFFPFALPSDRTFPASLPMKSSAHGRRNVIYFLPPRR